MRVFLDGLMGTRMAELHETMDHLLFLIHMAQARPQELAMLRDLSESLDDIFNAIGQSVEADGEAIQSKLASVRCLPLTMFGYTRFSSSRPAPKFVSGSEVFYR